MSPPSPPTVAGPPGPRPALFDLQVNGFAGVDFQQPAPTAAALGGALAALRRHSIGRILLTLITDEPDALRRKLEHLERLRAALPRAREMIAGYHLEGPWLNPAPGFHGAHPPALLRRPDPEELRRLQESAGGHIRLLTLAPELPGGIELVHAARELGPLVSLGHTDASAAVIDRAIAAGATLCTHLGNGVPGQLARHDNVVQRLLARDELAACFIPDGHHLPPFVLRNFYRAKPPGQVVLCSDAMAAAGAPAGRYTLGRLDVAVGADGVVREPGRPNFAGSALTLDRGVADAARWLGLAAADAWALGSTAAAARFGLTLPTLPLPPDE